MTREQIELAFKTKRLQLSSHERFSHYAPVVFLSILPLVFIIIFALGKINGKTSEKEDELIAYLLVTVIGFLIFYWFQYSKLRFKTVQKRIDKQKLLEVYDLVSEQLKWETLSKGENYIVAVTHPHFTSGSWGERITVVFNTDQIMINSICDPHKKSSFISAGRNQRNTSYFLKQIEKL